jgi:hypothetical protein
VQAAWPNAANLLERPYPSPFFLLCKSFVCGIRGLITSGDRRQKHVAKRYIGTVDTKVLERIAAPFCCEARCNMMRQIFFASHWTQPGIVLTNASRRPMQALSPIRSLQRLIRRERIRQARKGTSAAATAVSDPGRHDEQNEVPAAHRLASHLIRHSMHRPKLRMHLAAALSIGNLSPGDAIAPLPHESSAGWRNPRLRWIDLRR